MIDFTKCRRLKKPYPGANGKKIAIEYEGENYMLKFPNKPSINKEMSYANGCISEYIGSHIFNMLGVPAQDTLLGTIKENNKEYLVVACKDFENNGYILKDFASLKNTVIDTSRSGYGTDLEEVLGSIENQTSIDKELLKERFWDMFIVDALIGNWDRHNGNWGFLYNQELDDIILAPVYDCGSALFPQADDKLKEDIINNVSEQNSRVYNMPLSALKINDAKINYFDFISSLGNEDCNKALKRIYPKIKLDEIYKMIDDIDYISSLDKEFYKTMLKARKEKILDYSYQKLLNID